MVHAEVAHEAAIAVTPHQYRRNVMAVEDTQVQGVALIDRIGQHLGRRRAGRKLGRIGEDLFHVGRYLCRQGGSGNRNNNGHDNSMWYAGRCGR